MRSGRYKLIGTQDADSSIYSAFTLERRRTNTVTIPVLASFLYGSTTLYLLSALLGMWAAFDRRTALIRFVLICAGIVIMLALPRLAAARQDRLLGWFGLLCAVGAALLGGYYLFITAFSRGMASPTPGQTGTHLLSMHENMVAGGLIILLPFAVSGLYWASQRRLITATVLSVAAVGTGSVALIVTASRGALVGLVAGIGLAAYSSWRAERRVAPAYKIVADIFVVGSLLAFLGLYIAVITGNPLGLRVDQFIGLSTWGGSATSRLQLWRDSMVLLGDYPIIGSGLTGTEMVYTTYVFLLHTPYLYHAHNVYLQVAVEQGLPGLVAFLGIAGSTLFALFMVWPVTTGQTRRFAFLTLVSLCGMLVHGLFDAQLYVSVFLPILFVPLGAALLLFRQINLRHGESPRAYYVARRNRFVLGLAAMACLVLAAGLLLSRLRVTTSMIAANIGAVMQTQGELGLYEWPTWPIQDAVRVERPAVLSPALIWYVRALEANPANLTAQRRMGQIELSMGHYAQAERLLAQAYATAPGQRVTRQLYGEARAVTGDVDGAAALWRGNGMEQDPLDIRIWWYESIGAQAQADAVRQAALASRDSAGQ